MSTRLSSKDLLFVNLWLYISSFIKIQKLFVASAVYKLGVAKYTRTGEFASLWNCHERNKRL